MAEDPVTGDHLDEVDGVIYCVKKGQTLTETDKEAIRAFRRFLSMSPEEKRQHYFNEMFREGDGGANPEGNS